MALREYHQSTKEDAEIEFADKAFPLNVAPKMELSIDFWIKITKGSVLKDCSVWFFIADEFELVEPLHSWRQHDDYDLPNVRTVKIDFSTLSIGSKKPGHLKIKTPSIPGKYILRYKVKGEGFIGSNNDLIILVG